MPGKTSTQLDKTSQKTELTLTQSKHLNGLLNDARRHMTGVQPDVAYQQGFSMSLANKHEPERLGVMLLGELERLVRHVSATRTFQTQGDLQDAVDDICELFPSLKVEEILSAFKHIRQGRYKLFGNFTTNTLLDCIRQYEMENTVTFREQEHKQRKEVLCASLDVKRLINDLDRDGKLKMSRKTLDRKYIPYPNDKTDAKHETDTTKEKDRTKT